MQLPTAQLAALSIHGNAMMQGFSFDHFFPNNSTCQFCKSITFVHLQQQGANLDEAVIAESPDEWLEMLRQQETKGFRIHRHSVDDPAISDRMAAGFVGGGGNWLLEVMDENTSDFWEPKWIFEEGDSSQQGSWIVSYGRVAWEQPTIPHEPAVLPLLVRRFEKLLPKLATFARENHYDNFADLFDLALSRLKSQSPLKDTVHEDIAPPGFLSIDAQRLIAATQAAWVFGGMGSWNDIVFEGDAGQTYDSLSEDLFEALNSAIIEAANSSIERHND